MEFAIGQNYNRYAVEVSGWDAYENFFVERTTLTWSGQGSKEINVACFLREGCVVFIRLLQPLSSANGFPIAYRAVRVTNRREGRNTIQLEQLRPRAFFKDVASARKYSGVRVA